MGRVITLDITWITPIQIVVIALAVAVYAWVVNQQSVILFLLDGSFSEISIALGGALVAAIAIGRGIGWIFQV